MSKGIASTLLILTVAGGILISLITSTLLEKKPSVVSTPRATTCGPPINLTTLRTACCFTQTNSTCNRYERVYAHKAARIANNMTTPCTTACYGTAYNATSWYECPDSTVDHCTDPTRTPTPSCLSNGSSCGTGRCCSNFCNPSTRICTAQPTSTRPPTPTFTPRPRTNCTADGNNCSSNASCCSGYCNPTSGFCWPRPSPTRTNTPPPGSSRTPTPPSRLTAGCWENGVRSIAPNACCSSGNICEQDLFGSYACIGATCSALSPSPTRRPSPTIPPAQACSQGQETYSLNQLYCDETNNIVRKCLGNNNWQPVSPNPCLQGSCTNSPSTHSISCSAKCLSLFGNSPGRKLKVAFLPENYTSINDFKQAAQTAINEISKTNLKSSGLMDKMNFYIVNDLSHSYHTSYSNPYENIDFDKIDLIGKSFCGANTSIVIDNPSRCGTGEGGMARLGFSAYSCSPNGNTVPHELAHSIGLINDEYGDSTNPVNQDILNYLGPNCTTNSTCSNWSSLSGIVCSQGCGGLLNSDDSRGFSNWYRPTESGIMRADRSVYNFNSPSLKAWQDRLRNY